MVSKATTCIRAHDCKRLGIKIQLSSLNFKTSTRGLLSQLTDYCLKLKISASTRAREVTFSYIGTKLLLKQRAQWISAAGASSLALSFSSGLASNSAKLATTRTENEERVFQKKPQWEKCNNTVVGFFCFYTCSEM